MDISKTAESILKSGTLKRRINRAGMFQQMTFKVVTRTIGNIKYVVLSTERTIDLSELVKMANETGLPVEAQNGKAFPEGKSAMDFKTE